MAPTQNEHLTTEQLSTSLDRQLSLEEQTAFDAHIVSCRQCQNKLADLRLTATLLQALPVEEVPRAFTLPESVPVTTDLPARHNATITPMPSRRGTQHTALRRSIRLVSALAAVLALCFIISGMLPLVSSGGMNSTSSTSSVGTYNPANKANPNATATGAEQSNHALHENPATVIAQGTENAHTGTQPGAATPTTHSDHSSNTNSSTGIQPTIDLSQPGVRLSIGIIVLAVSIIALILTRRRKVMTRSSTS